MCWDANDVAIIPRRQNEGTKRRIDRTNKRENKLCSVAYCKVFDFQRGNRQKMIYLFTALHAEADLFIKRFHLEKNLSNARFQEFYQEHADIRLTITGVGEIAAAAAVSSVCTAYKPNKGDILLNIGTCAHLTGNNGVFVCNKIIELATGKTFYPDLLYCHALQEETIVTGMLPCNQEEYRKSVDIERSLAENSSGNLYDMEAAAIYQAGSYFFGPHQMMFLKVVSDTGLAKEVSKEKVKHCMETNQEPLFKFIEEISIIAQENKQRDNIFQQEEVQMETLYTDLHCSKVMRDSLKQHIHYWELAGIDYVSVIQDMYRGGLLPCRDKREGKLCFEELKRKLF